MTFSAFSSIKPNVNGLKNQSQDNKMVQAGSVPANFFHTTIRTHTHNEPLALNDDNKLESVGNANRAVTDTGKQLVEGRLDKPRLFGHSSLRPDINLLIAQGQGNAMVQAGLGPNKFVRKPIHIRSRDTTLAQGDDKKLEAVKNINVAKRAVTRKGKQIVEGMPHRQEHSSKPSNLRSTSKLGALPPIFRTNTPTTDISTEGTPEAIRTASP